MPYVNLDTTVANKLELASFSAEESRIEYITLPLNSNWKSTALAIQVDATQTFGATPLLQAKLDISWGIGKIVVQNEKPVAQFDLKGIGQLVWADPFTYQDHRIYQGVLDIPPYLEGKPTHFIVKLVYKVAGLTPYTQSCTYNIEATSKIFSETGTGATPIWGAVTTIEDPGTEPEADWMQYVPIIIGGGILVAGIYALGIVGKEFREERAIARDFGGSMRGGGGGGDLGKELKGIGRGIKSFFKS